MDDFFHCYYQQRRGEVELWSSRAALGVKGRQRNNQHLTEKNLYHFILRSQ